MTSSEKNSNRLSPVSSQPHLTVSIPTLAPNMSISISACLALKSLALNRPAKYTQKAGSCLYPAHLCKVTWQPREATVTNNVKPFSTNKETEAPRGCCLSRSSSRGLLSSLHPHQGTVPLVPGSWQLNQGNRNASPRPSSRSMLTKERGPLRLTVPQKSSFPFITFPSQISNSSKGLALNGLISRFHPQAPSLIKSPLR